MALAGDSDRRNPVLACEGHGRGGVENRARLIHGRSARAGRHDQLIPADRVPPLGVGIGRHAPRGDRETVGRPQPAITNRCGVQTVVEPVKVAVSAARIA